MKLAATIAEYNPFHNGHVKHIEYIKENLRPDCLAVIMSGNFVQRGEAAVCDKYTRAAWAIKGGADIVIELPVVFSSANAETFCKGAVKLLADLKTPVSLCFGAECGKYDDYIAAAKYFSDESKEYKAAVREFLDKGLSPVKARYEAAKQISPENVNIKLLESPNSILGLEYTKAVMYYKALIDIFPMKRISLHDDDRLYKKVTSAYSIRTAIGNVRKGKLKTVMPKYVYENLPKALPDMSQSLVSFALSTSPEQFKNVPDCTEGLENRIQCLMAQNPDFHSAVKKIVTARYTSSRINRILVENMLGITNQLTNKALTPNEPLYFKVLAANKNGLEFIGETKERTKIPFLTRKAEYSALTKTAAAVFEKDVLACRLYGLFSGKKLNEFATEIM